jgi:hypothetical protein
METAHSLPPESAGSRSTGWRCRGVDVASTGSAQSFFACGVLILPNCRHTLCCTAEWWRRECAGEAGRSRCQRQWCVPGGGATRFQQTGIVRPAVGASTGGRRLAAEICSSECAVSNLTRDQPVKADSNCSKMLHDRRRRADRPRILNVCSDEQQPAQRPARWPEPDAMFAEAVQWEGFATVVSVSSSPGSFVNHSVLYDSRTGNATQALISMKAAKNLGT